MILGPAANGTEVSDNVERTTLDDLFRRAGVRRPDAIALVDPQNRESFTDGSPRCLTFAEADRVVSAIAGRLRQLNLPTDSIVGLQMPNTVECILTLLGVIRAGLIPSLLPLLWRQKDAVAALSLVDAKALITCARVGRENHCELAMQIAAEVFTIRQVCVFGSISTDGVSPFDELFTARNIDPLPPIERAGNPADHVAVITWDAGTEGIIPIARTHSELLTGGFAPLTEAGLAQDATILSTLAPSSFAGLALSVVPWLITGGTLVLHHAFNPTVFKAQCEQYRCTAAIVPGPLLARFIDAQIFDVNCGLKTVLAAWRTPERLVITPTWRKEAITLVDVQAFGEIGLVSARRNDDGQPASIVTGRLTAPRGAPDAVIIAEIERTANGRLAMRGPMAPHYPFPPGIERTVAPCLQIDADGFVDTGYSCRLNRDNEILTITRPPPGMVSVGGYRFCLNELQNIVTQIADGSTLVALPDTLSGYRLAGTAEDRTSMRQELIRLGLNPLVVAAFRERQATVSRTTDRANAA